MLLKCWKFLSGFILLKSLEISLNENSFVTVLHLTENVEYACILTNQHIHIYIPNEHSLHCNVYLCVYIHIYICNIHTYLTGEKCIY